MSPNYYKVKGFFVCSFVYGLLFITEMLWSKIFVERPPLELREAFLRGYSFINSQENESNENTSSSMLIAWLLTWPLRSLPGLLQVAVINDRGGMKGTPPSKTGALFQRLFGLTHSGYFAIQFICLKWASFTDHRKAAEGQKRLSSPVC